MLAGTSRRPTAPGLRTLIALVAGGVLSFLLVYFLLQLNPALGTVVSSLWFWVRFAFIASLAGRPGGRYAASANRRRGERALVAVAVAVCGTGRTGRRDTDAGARRHAAGDVARHHLARLLDADRALVSLPLFVAAVLIVRHFAPVRLRFTGAVLGLFAGAMAALVYTALP